MRSIYYAAFAAVASLGLAACGGGVNGAGGGTPQALSGSVLGGQQPVEDSTVTLYVAGIGPASAAVLATTTTGVNGTFNLPSFSCPAVANVGDPKPQAYIVASGGNPGMTTGTDNQAIRMMAALGDCADMPAFVNINEVTTVAAGYALNGFIGAGGCVNCDGNLPTDVTNVHGKEPGLTNAFSIATRLVDVSQGAASPPFNSAVICVGSSAQANCGLVKRIHSLANSLAACVNTTDGASAQCTQLFACATPGAGYTGGICTAGTGYTQASDTMQALLYIARNPAQVSRDGVYHVATQNAVFSPNLTSVPTDWTLAMQVADGLDEPMDLAIDAGGNVWTVGTNALQKFAPDGTLLSPLGGYGLRYSGFKFPWDIAIDSMGYVWTASAPTFSFGVQQFSPDGTKLSSGANGHSPGARLAIAPSGFIWISRILDDSIYPVNSTGAPATGDVYTGGGLDIPIPVAVDAAGNVWTGSTGNHTINKFTGSGVPLSGTSGFTVPLMQRPLRIAISPTSDVWVTDDSGHVFILTANGTVYGSNTNGGLGRQPAGLAIDAAGHAWVANRTNSISEFRRDGTAASPAGGYTGLALNAAPESLAIDSAGNVWVAQPNLLPGGQGQSGNLGRGSLSVLIGAAAPTRTPLVSAIKDGFTP